MKQINVPVSEDVYAAAKMGAAAAGIPMKDWVARAILQFSAACTFSPPGATTSARAVETDAPESPQFCTSYPRRENLAVGAVRQSETDAPGELPAHPFVTRACRRCGKENVKGAVCVCSSDAPGELTIDLNPDFGA